MGEVFYRLSQVVTLRGVSGCHSISRCLSRFWIFCACKVRALSCVLFLRPFARFPAWKHMRVTRYTGMVTWPELHAVRLPKRAVPTATPNGFFFVNFSHLKSCFDPLNGEY